MSRQVEEWRDIPGYNGFYQVSDWGRIRSFLYSSRYGIRRAETPHFLRINIIRRTGRNYVVLRKDGKKINRSLLSLVADAFLGGIPRGMCPYRKNRDIEDSSAWNIGFRRTGEFLGSLPPPNRRPVVKMDRTLEIIAVYRSAKAAAVKNYLNPATVEGYCNLKNKSVFSLDGHIYAWDDDNWLRKTLARARAELDAVNARYNDPYTERYYDLPAAPDVDPDPDIVWSEAPACGGGVPIWKQPDFNRSVTA